MLIRDIKNKRFGMLIPYEKQEGRKNGNFIWKCKCDCGNEISLPTVALTIRKKTSCGCVKKIKSVRKPQPILERLMSKIRYTESCWIWEGTKYKGYGCIQIKGKHCRPHRLLFEHFKGEIPKGMSLCHFCDNPSCVNPDHLWIGTTQDNSNDMIKKGRSLKGTKNHKCIIDDDKALYIRFLCDNGYSVLSISKYFDISRGAIYAIKYRKNWKHL